MTLVLYHTKVRGGEMKNLTLHTPEGVRDIYNSEYEQRLDVLYNLRKCFKDSGYSPISTPTFEYFDTFSKEVGSCKSNEMFKFFDRDGNTLVLRPDITPSVARAAAMYFSDTDEAVKLCYEGNVFINYHSLQGRLKESTQAGCEFIGDSSVDADAEILTIVVNALKSIGLKEFQIGVGHIDIVRGLIDAANLSEEKECLICKDKTRDKDILCVVEESKNIVLFEKVGTFNGRYHVLNGLISPLDGINPEDINIDSLIKRIDKEKIKEVIIAVKPTVEGETTALYIRKLLENKNIIVSKIAHGIPIGADIDYIDPLTLEIALSERSKIS